MEDPIDEFILFLDAERGLSVNYQLSTRRSVENFLAWAGAKTPPKGVGEIGPTDLTDFLAHRKRQGLAAASVRLEAVALRVFFRFLAARKMVEKDPATHLGGPRAERYLPETLPAEAVGRLLDCIPDKTPAGLRDKAIFELLYSSGLRAGEVCNLRVEEFYPEERMVRVVGGKGDKSRVVPVGGSALEAIDAYLLGGRPHFVRPRTGSHLFLSVRGRALTPQRLWQLSKTYASLAGLDENVYPHLFRHSFASHLLANGADLRVIQEMLGHADICTTQVYTHVDKDHLKSLHSKYHPRSRLNPRPPHGRAGQDAGAAPHYSNSQSK